MFICVKKSFIFNSIIPIFCVKLEVGGSNFRDYYEVTAPIFYIDVTLNIMDLKRRNAYGLMVPVPKKEGRDKRGHKANDLCYRHEHLGGLCRYHTQHWWD